MGTFVLAPVIGDGSMTNPYRAKSVVGNHTALILSDMDPGAVDTDPMYDENGNVTNPNYMVPTNPNYGHPAKMLALVYSSADPSVLQADPDLRVIPGSSLDNVINAAGANIVNNKLSQYGIPALVVAGMTRLQAINAIGGYLSPGWSYSMEDFTVL